MRDTCVSHVCHTHVKETFHATHVTHVIRMMHTCDQSFQVLITCVRNYTCDTCVITAFKRHGACIKYFSKCPPMCPITVIVDMYLSSQVNYMRFVTHALYMCFLYIYTGKFCSGKFHARFTSNKLIHETHVQLM